MPQCRAHRAKCRWENRGAAHHWRELRACARAGVFLPTNGMLQMSSLRLSWRIVCSAKVASTRALPRSHFPWVVGLHAHPKLAGLQGSHPPELLQLAERRLRVMAAEMCQGTSAHRHCMRRSCETVSPLGRRAQAMQAIAAVMPFPSDLIAPGCVHRHARSAKARIRHRGHPIRRGWLPSSLQTPEEQMLGLLRRHF